MARYVQDIVLNKPDDFVAFIMNDYLQKNQFAMSDWKGEPVYRAGDAMLEGFKFMKWSYVNGVLHLEAWLKGTMGGEWDLEGFVGCAMKKPYKKDIENLLQVLKQDIPNPGNAQAAGAGPQVVPVQTVDNCRSATMALVFGILSILLVWIPLVSIILACFGFSRARMGSGSSKGGLATAGKVCSVLGCVLAIILWILNILASVGMLLG